MEDYELEKWIWTEKDFEKMGWHDSMIYGMRLNEDFMLDIDYIFQWNNPEVEGFRFTFWVAPATLVFEKPFNMSFELTHSWDDNWLEIMDIELSQADKQKTWTIITRQGYISFTCDGYKQIIRRKPSFQFGQTIPYDERGGNSFDLTPGDRLKYEINPEIMARRKREREFYEFAKSKFILLGELEKLNEKRDSGEVNLKDFLIERKRMKERIDLLTFQLRGTGFDIV